MREVQIVRWCDGDHSEPEPAVIERTVVVDGCDPILLDLCAEHDSQFFVPMLVLMEFGVPVDTSVASTTCGRCGFQSKSRAALGQHMRARHGTGLKVEKKA